ncbi:LuxS/MPP-like metallohydrolase [Choiromyces venosus 120613-1]|uniref:LuxS/MPP-like metallohydrolase n=1 Tax=Choiromyces venosus 120613-1 TaxID=1336337 RepID=A0A3N4K002_9PEZI|nr:LuxS/MPP-like metallohydrolase [Choiromyces venosus 120613-1]
MPSDTKELPIRSSGATVVADKLEQPALDNRSYRVVQLSNKLEALIVHDPDTDKASAALDVHAGNFSDKDDLPPIPFWVPSYLMAAVLGAGGGWGQAHAVEHLLFMGTEKYPKENEYSQYLAANSGLSNAYTASTSTNYYFEVGHEAFYGALDRFAQFFIAPLFLAETLDRELRAVDSENKKNLQNDIWRIHQLSKSLSNPKHPYCHFSTGNLETLKEEPAKRGINVRDEFLKFHEKYYSANVMKLVVLGREDLDTLEKWVVEFFEGVKNKDLPDPTFEGQPLTDKELLTQIFAKPVMDTKSLEVTFTYPDEEKLFEYQPARYCAHLIGHEGPGSILALLKKKGWVDTLSAGPEPTCNDAALFRICLRLTEDGLENYEEVIKIVFEYIHLIRCTPPQEWVVRELQAVAAVDFKFRQKTPASKFTSRLSAVMQKPLPREWLLSGTSLVRKFDASIISKSLEYLNPNNFRLTVVSKECPRGDWEAKERWYGTEYRVEKIPEKLLSEIREIFNNSRGLSKELHLPHRNEFIPTNFEVHHKEVKEPQKAPVLIKNTETARIWYKKDDTFWVPKASLNCILRNPLGYCTPGNAVRVDLYCRLVKDALNEYAYDAEIAGLEYNLWAHNIGLDLEISGYNDKMPVLLEKLLLKMRDLEITPDRFKAIKDMMARDLRNWDFAPPYHQVGEYARYLLAPNMWLNDDIRVELGNTTLEDVKNFFPQVVQQFHLEALVHGNLYKEDALRLTSLIETILKPRVLPPSQFSIRRSLVLPVGGKFIYTQPLRDEKNVNHCIDYSLFIGEHTDRALRAMSTLFSQLTEEPAFNQLRSKEQLGYVVFSGARMNAITIVYRFIIQSERTGPYLESRIEKFLADYKDTLEAMSEKEFKGHINSVIVKRTEKLKNLGQERKRLWGWICQESYDFLQIDIEVDILRNITKAEMLDFFKKYIDPASPIRSKVSVYLQAAAVTEGPKPGDKDAIIEKICKHISTHSDTETDPAVISKALTTVGFTGPQAAMSGFLRCLTRDLKLSPETAQSIIQEGAEMLITLLPSLAKAIAPPEEEGGEEGIADKGEIVEDVRAFKATLPLTKGPLPVKPLVEFEESSVKL